MPFSTPLAPLLQAAMPSAHEAGSYPVLAAEKSWYRGDSVTTRWERGLLVIER